MTEWEIRRNGTGISNGKIFQSINSIGQTANIRKSFLIALTAGDVLTVWGKNQTSDDVLIKKLNLTVRGIK
jgi:hypothetical protein